MKKYFKFSLIAILLLTVAGNTVAELVTLRFNAPGNMTNASNIHVYLWGELESGGIGYINTWPGDLVSIDANSYFTISYNNAGYNWINAEVNNGANNGYQQILKENVNSSSNNANVKDGGYWIIYSDNWNYIPHAQWPQARNTTGGGTPKQPEAIYLGDTELSFSCRSWGSVNSDNAGSKWQLCISKDRNLNNGYKTGFGNTSVNEEKTALSPQFTSTGTWYWGIQVNYNDNNPIAWYAQDIPGSGNDWATWTDMITTGELASKANLTVNVLPIPNPTYTINSGALSITKIVPNHNVMVVKTTNLSWEPTQGAAYSVGNEIIQNGTPSSVTVDPGFIYKIYSVNNNYYSSGITYIPDGKSLTLTGNVTLPGDLYLSSKAELVGNATLTANKIYAKITVPGTDTDQWHFVGLPFAVGRITDMAGKTLTIGTGDNDDYAIAGYNGKKRADNGSGGWTDITVAPSSESPLEAGGYIFWVNNKVSDLTLILEKVTHSITVNNSGTSTLIYHSGSVGDIHNGWNLIAHPLFSTADMELNGGQFLYAYNSADDTYTPSSGSVRNLKPFGSYFIKIVPDQTSVSLASATAQSLAPQSVSGRDEKVTVYLGNEETPYLTKIHLNTNATVEYDELYDAPHLMSMSAETPQIYTLINSDKMAINSIPEEASIGLGVRVPQAGEYTIRWDSQVAEKNVQLLDNANGESINMLANPSYTFTTSTGGEINDRFSISFVPAIVTRLIKTDNGTNGKIRISLRQKAIVLEGLSGSSAIQLYDLPGRHIHEGFTQGGTYQVPVSGKGIYLIEIKNENSTLKTKVICQ